MSSSGEGSNGERRAALDKVLCSEAFSRSDSSRSFLKFVVEKYLSGDLEDIKEYTIATEALGRPPDFDPKTDSIIRIQAQRLRKRLEEYYSHEGAGDRVRIIIPHGHYIPEFRTSANPQSPSEVEEPHLPGEPPKAASRVSRWLLVVVVVLLAAVTVLGVELFRALTQTRLPKQANLPSSLLPLWRVFLQPNDPPLIVYSNATFLSNDYGDVYRVSLSSGPTLPSGAKVPTLTGFDRVSPFLPRKGNLYYFDLYTGTGEVVAAAKIAQLLTSARQDFLLERSGLVSYDSMRRRNVIFLGASLEDPILAKLPVESDFFFDMPEGGQAAIHDRHPARGQPGAYSMVRDPKTGEFQTDYALLSLLPGIEPNTYILVAGGIRTLGTQAAAEFATFPAQMALLEKMCAGSGILTEQSPFFQSVLEVQVRNGTITRINCLLVRGLRRK